MSEEPTSGEKQVKHPFILWLGRSFSVWLDRAKMREQLFVVIIAVLIGVLCGFGAVGFRYLIEGFHFLFWGHRELTLDVLESMPIWKILLIPAVGGLIVGPIIFFYAREAKGHGVPEVMAAVGLKNGVIRGRVAVAKALASAITIASGGSAGREGPIIQIGAALGSAMGQLLQVSRRRMRTFVGCGAAAGIAATFNAPIAGAIFAVEVILAEFGVAQFSPIVISSVMATVIARFYFGDGPVFLPPPYEVPGHTELLAYSVLGILCGLVSVLFIRTLYFFEDRFDSIKRVPEYLKPMIGGLMLGGIGLAYPHVYGDGYGTINMALLNKIPIMMVLLLLFAKLVATSFTLGSGGSGGVFAPSLFLGAMSGSLVGQLVAVWFGHSPADAGGYALVGMGGMVAGTTHAPITAILIIFEITNNYSIILPLMTVCIISILISSRVSKESIYTMKLIRKGVDLFKGRSLDLLKAVPVKQCISLEVETVSPDLPVAKMVDLMLSTERSQFYVVDDAGRFVGCVLLSDLGRMLTQRHGLEQVLLADDLTNEDVLVCLPEENLSQAMHKFERSGMVELPVVEGGGAKKLLGCLRYTDVVAVYNSEIIKADTADELAERVASSAKQRRVKIADGFMLTEWDPPQSLWGKTLVLAQLPKRYNVRVILVKQKVGDRVETIVPGGDYRISENDTLVIYGPDEALEKVQHL